MRENFLDFKKYYQKAVAEIPSNSFYRESVDHKFKHSILVLHIGEEIMNTTPELQGKEKDFQKLAKTALLFHDVGRFSEAVMRCHTPNIIATAESINQFDHCLIGYNELKDNLSYNDERILLSVRCHGQMMDKVKSSEFWKETMAKPTGKEAEQILYLVRDADKMANLKVIKENDRLRKDIFFELLPQEALNSGISEIVKQQFFNKQTILSSTVFSFADRILQVISWIFDLNYQKTKEIFKQNQYAEHLLWLLAQYHPFQNEIEQIENLVKQNS